MSLKTILAEVADRYKLSPDELLSTSRRRYVVRPRQAFMWRARQETWADGSVRYSLPQIGRFLGKDHTSVLHGVRQHAKRLALSPERPQGYPQALSNVWTAEHVAVEALAKQRTITA